MIDVERHFLTSLHEPVILAPISGAQLHPSLQRGGTWWSLILRQDLGDTQSQQRQGIGQFDKSFGFQASTNADARAATSLADAPG